MSNRDGVGVGGCTRRAFMKGGMAGIGAAVAPTIAFAQAQPAQFKIGDIDAIVLSDGSMNMPVSFVLPTVEEKVVRDLFQTGAAPSIVAQVNVVVLKTGGGLVLIDAGGSADFIATIGSFADRFEQAGFKAEHVTDIVLTHAHPDHLWGAIDGFDESRFAKARVHMSVAERDFWMQPGLTGSMPDPLKGMTAGTQRRLKIIEAQISGQKIGAEILPGISLVDTAGHTPGHASVLISSKNEALLVGGDALSNAIVSFEKPDWIWGPDFEPDKAIASRKQLLDRLATDRLRLVGYHLPWPGLGRVERKDNAYRFVTG